MTAWVYKGRYRDGWKLCPDCGGRCGTSAERCRACTAIAARRSPNLDPLVIGADDECWPWTGCTTPGGYGYVYHEGRMRMAHRVLYELLVAPIPDGLYIDHLCRNRLCQNPAHMEVVTHRENTLRGHGPSAVNARKTQCIHGHEFTHFDNLGRRLCRTCARERMRRTNAKRRAKT